MKNKLEMIAKQSMKHLLISLFITSIFSAVPHKDYNQWRVLQDDGIWIAYTETDYPWCKAKMIFENTTDEILNVIENVDSYHLIFDSIKESTKDKNDIAYILFDFPILFKDRDYVVKFELILEDNDIVYKYNAIKNPFVVIPLHLFRIDTL